MEKCFSRSPLSEAQLLSLHANRAASSSVDDADRRSHTKKRPPKKPHSRDRATCDAVTIAHNINAEFSPFLLKKSFSGFSKKHHQNCCNVPDMFTNRPLRKEIDVEQANITQREEKCRKKIAEEYKKLLRPKHLFEQHLPFGATTPKMVPMSEKPNNVESKSYLARKRRKNHRKTEPHEKKPLIRNKETKLVENVELDTDKLRHMLKNSQSGVFYIDPQKPPDFNDHQCQKHELKPPKTTRKQQQKLIDEIQKKQLHAFHCELRNELVFAQRQQSLKRPETARQTSVQKERAKISPRPQTAPKMETTKPEVVESESKHAKRKRMKKLKKLIDTKQELQDLETLLMDREQQIQKIKTTTPRKEKKEAFVVQEILPQAKPNKKTDLLYNNLNFETQESGECQRHDSRRSPPSIQEKIPTERKDPLEQITRQVNMEKMQDYCQKLYKESEYTDKTRERRRAHYDKMFYENYCKLIEANKEPSPKEESLREHKPYKEIFPTDVTPHKSKKKRVRTAEEGSRRRTVEEDTGRRTANDDTRKIKLLYPPDVQEVKEQNEFQHKVKETKKQPKMMVLYEKPAPIQEATTFVNEPQVRHVKHLQKVPKTDKKLLLEPGKISYTSAVESKHLQTFYPDETFVEIPLSKLVRPDKRSTSEKPRNELKNYDRDCEKVQAALKRCELSSGRTHKSKSESSLDIKVEKRPELQDVFVNPARDTYNVFYEQQKKKLQEKLRKRRLREYIQQITKYIDTSSISATTFDHKKSVSNLQVINDLEELINSYAINKELKKCRSRHRSKQKRNMLVYLDKKISKLGQKLQSQDLSEAQMDIVNQTIKNIEPEVKRKDVATSTTLDNNNIYEIIDIITGKAVDNKTRQKSVFHVKKVASKDKVIEAYHKNGTSSKHTLGFVVKGIEPPKKADKHNQVSNPRKLQLGFKNHPVIEITTPQPIKENHSIGTDPYIDPVESKMKRLMTYYEISPGSGTKITTSQTSDVEQKILQATSLITEKPASLPQRVHSEPKKPKKRPEASLPVRVSSVPIRKTKHPTKKVLKEKVSNTTTLTDVSALPKTPVHDKLIPKSSKTTKKPFNISSGTSISTNYETISFQPVLVPKIVDPKPVKIFENVPMIKHDENAKERSNKRSLSNGSTESKVTSPRESNIRKTVSPTSPRKAILKKNVFKNVMVKKKSGTSVASNRTTVLTPNVQTIVQKSTTSIASTQNQLPRTHFEPIQVPPPEKKQLIKPKSINTLNSVASRNLSGISLASQRSQQSTLKLTPKPSQNATGTAGSSTSNAPNSGNSTATCIFVPPVTKTSPVDSTDSRKLNKMTTCVTSTKSHSVPRTTKEIKSKEVVVAIKKDSKTNERKEITKSKEKVVAPLKMVTQTLVQVKPQLKKTKSNLSTSTISVVHIVESKPKKPELSVVKSIMEIPSSETVLQSDSQSEKNQKSDSNTVTEQTPRKLVPGPKNEQSFAKTDSISDAAASSVTKNDNTVILNLKSNSMDSVNTTQVVQIRTVPPETTKDQNEAIKPVKNVSPVSSIEKNKELKEPVMSSIEKCLAWDNTQVEPPKPEVISKIPVPFSKTSLNTLPNTSTVVQNERPKSAPFKSSLFLTKSNAQDASASALQRRKEYDSSHRQNLKKRSHSETKDTKKDPPTKRVYEVRYFNIVNQSVPDLFTKHNSKKDLVFMPLASGDYSDKTHSDTSKSTIKTLNKSGMRHKIGDNNQKYIITFFDENIPVVTQKKPPPVVKKRSKAEKIQQLIDESLLFTDLNTSPTQKQRYTPAKRSLKKRSHKTVIKDSSDALNHRNTSDATPTTNTDSLTAPVSSNANFSISNEISYAKEVSQFFQKCSYDLLESDANQKIKLLEKIHALESIGMELVQMQNNYGQESLPVVEGSSNTTVSTLVPTEILNPNGLLSTVASTSNFEPLKEDSGFNSVSKDITSVSSLKSSQKPMNNTVKRLEKMVECVVKPQDEIEIIIESLDQKCPNVSSSLPIISLKGPLGKDYSMKLCPKTNSSCPHMSSNKMVTKKPKSLVSRSKKVLEQLFASAHKFHDSLTVLRDSNTKITSDSLVNNNSSFGDSLNASSVSLLQNSYTTKYEDSLNSSAQPSEISYSVVESTKNMAKRKSFIELFKIPNSDIDDQLNVASVLEKTLNENALKIPSDDEFLNSFHKLMSEECSKTLEHETSKNLQSNLRQNDFKTDFKELPLKEILSTSNKLKITNSMSIQTLPLHDLEIIDTSCYVRSDFSFAAPNFGCINRGVQTILKMLPQISLVQNDLVVIREDPRETIDQRLTIDYYPEERMSMECLAKNHQNEDVKSSSSSQSTLYDSISAINLCEKSSGKIFLDNMLTFYDKETEMLQRLLSDNDFFATKFKNDVLILPTPEIKEKKKGGLKNYLRKKMSRTKKTSSSDTFSETEDSSTSLTNFKRVEQLLKETDSQIVKPPNHMELQQLAKKVKYYLVPLFGASMSQSNIQQDKLKLAGFYKFLNLIENGDFTFLQGENLEEKLKLRIQQMFRNVLLIAEKQAAGRNSRLIKPQIELLKLLVTKYFVGPESHMNFLAIYIGSGLIDNREQLEDGILYLMQLSTSELDIENFENHIGINKFF